jgi:glycerol-3-phosphate dehydrogenase
MTMEIKLSDLIDVFVIGGGVNGCGIARDAAGRGYSVYLAEMNDLASGTSSWSSKLIHGGLRYLEHYEFRLVREALSEREVLLKAAPHIIWPMRFILPHHKDLRPAWLLRAGLFLYDYIGKRKLLPPTRTVNLKTDETGKPLKPLFTKGFEYSDCWVNDARLVILNAMDAQERGASINTQTKVISAVRSDDIWVIKTQDMQSGDVTEHKARIVINAAGPWVDKVLGQAAGVNDAKNVRLVQGSHIVVPKLHDHDRAYIFQNADGRIIFALPYEQDFTLIGTTDQDYEGDPSDVKITPKERSYLCDAASEYFQKPIVEDDIVWTYSGVRPLFDDGATAAQEATRDYVLKKEQPNNQAAMINIFGGKITTFRRLAESMLEKIEETIGAKGSPWTAEGTLPGGDFLPSEYEAKVNKLAGEFSFLEKKHAARLVRSYGTNAWKIVENAKSYDDLGEKFAHSLTEAEVKYLMENEWVTCADDVLWRRSKLGIRYSKNEIKQLEDWFAGLK